MAATDSRGRSPVAVGLVALLLVAAAAVGAAALDPDPSGERLLDDATDRYGNAETVVGTAEVTVTNATNADATNATGTRTATVEVATARPNATRVSVDRPDGPAVTAGTNGSVAWAYDEESGQLRIVRTDAAGEWDLDGAVPTNGSWVTGDRGDWSDAPARPADWNESSGHDVSRADLRAAWNATAWVREPGALADAIDDNTTAERLGRESVRGVDAYRLRVRPTNGTWNATVEVWIGAAERDLLRSEVSRDGWTTTVEYDLAVNASVHESTFRPPTERADAVVAPRTVDSYDAAVDAAGRDLPRLDAAGVAFESATVIERDGVTTVAQSYAAGLDVTGTDAAADVAEGDAGGPTTVLLVSADAGPEALPGGFASGEAAGEGNATTVSVDGTAATLVERGDRTAVVWTGGSGDDERTVAVVGRLPADALVDLAGSVVG